jgi:hypothetical protein
MIFDQRARCRAGQADLRCEGMFCQIGRKLAASNSADMAAILALSEHTIHVVHGRKGPSTVFYMASSEVLLITDQPLLDAARLLLKIGCDPNAFIAKRRFGSFHHDIRAPLAAAATLTVDVGRTRFRRWRPLSAANAASLGASFQDADAKSASSRKSHPCLSVTMLQGGRP